MSLAEIDTLVFFVINRDLQNSLFDILMPFVTHKSYTIFLTLFLWFLFKDKKNALIVLVLAFTSLLIADWSANTLKHLFECIRPCNELNGVRLLVKCNPSSFSMPSNHAANAFAFVTPFFITFKDRMRYALVVVAFFVGLSRVYVGVHYPSDVIVGGVIGVALAIFVSVLYTKTYERFKKRNQ
jgi:undecaprenyl-diphosphatase